MSIESYTVKAVRCDIRVAKDCADEYEALAGKSAVEARKDAASDGWRRARGPLNRSLRDACPPCVALLEKLFDNTDTDTEGSEK